LQEKLPETNYFFALYVIKPPYKGEFWAQKIAFNAEPYSYVCIAFNNSMSYLHKIAVFCRVNFHQQKEDSLWTDKLDFTENCRSKNIKHINNVRILPTFLLVISDKGFEGILATSTKKNYKLYFGHSS
jgi:hypothetical protein